MENAKERLAQAVKEAEEIVYSYLPAEEGHQKTIFEAMNYSVKAGGKRLRPILMREVYRLFGGQGKEIEPLMAAIEMIHTSSLFMTIFHVWTMTSTAVAKRRPGLHMGMIWQFWREMPF